MEDRKQVRSINLRSFHNWIKSALIRIYIDKLRAESIKNISVFDAAAGKGGDL